jgi:hypothetical protein
MLKFPDNTQVRVVGLDEILAEVYSEGRQPNNQTAEEILDRLEKHNNYIPPLPDGSTEASCLRSTGIMLRSGKNKAPSVDLELNAGYFHFLSFVSSSAIPPLTGIG